MPDRTHTAARSPAPAAGPFRQLGRCACGGTSGPTGECAACRRKRQFGLQPNLRVNQPGDRYEQEADRVAEAVMHGGPTSVPLPITPLVQRSGGGDVAAAPPEVDAVLASPGRPLDGGTRRAMEGRFGHDLSAVRVHTGWQAAESAEAVAARAYTVGRDVVFGAGQYRPHAAEGRRLLAHELAHVVQQQGPEPVLQRGPNDAQAEVITLDYEDAKRMNQRYASELGWEERFYEMDLMQQTRERWAALWGQGGYPAFADEIAAFQAGQGIPVDGVLGPSTWDRVRPLGEVVAERRVDWADSLGVCTTASEERLTEGFKQGTGDDLVPADQSPDFNTILHSRADRIMNVDERYRGTGAAGALVFIGRGTFVDEEQMWDRKALRPGAAVQVWKREGDVENLRKGEEPSSWGTSFVFVRYTSDDAMHVLHYDREEAMSRSKFEFWVGANLTARVPEPDPLTGPFPLP